MKDTLHFTFGIFGNITALALILAPGVTFYKIGRRGSTEEFSGIPYVCTMLNCMIFAWYGLPFITTHNVLLITVNGVGTALEFIYVCIFLMYAPPKPRIKIARILIGVLAFFATVAVISLVALRQNARKLFVGSIAMAISVCMYASPLSIMRSVIQTKSVQYMPFLLSVFVFLCGASWFLYGILGKDAFIAGPNGVGASLGMAQLVLYFKYKDSTPRKSQADHEGGKVPEADLPFSLPHARHDVVGPQANHHETSLEIKGVEEN